MHFCRFKSVLIGVPFGLLNVVLIYDWWYYFSKFDMPVLVLDHFAVFKKFPGRLCIDGIVKYCFCWRVAHRR